MFLKTSAAVGSLLMVFSAPVWAMNVSQFLNKANQINYDEVQSAKVAQNKAGDNQALVTFADTIQADHMANEQAVSALSRQKDITLYGFNPPQNQLNNLRNLNGGAFNQTFLSNEIRDHEKAIRLFQQARQEFNGSPDVELYIQQSLPVLHAHLAMAENLDRSMAQGTSPQNPSNNKNAANNGGENSNQMSRNYSNGANSNTGMSGNSNNSMNGNSGGMSSGNNNGWSGNNDMSGNNGMNNNGQ